MAAFNVSKVDLTTFGYPEKYNFGDPMEPLFRAKAYSGTTDLVQIKNALLPSFQNLDAYPDAQAVEKALDDYYNSLATKTTASTSTVVKSSKATTTTTSRSTLVTSTKATTTSCTKTSGQGKGGGC